MIDSDIDCVKVSRFISIRTMLGALKTLCIYDKNKSTIMVLVLVDKPQLLPVVAQPVAASYPPMSRPHRP